MDQPTQELSAELLLCPRLQKSRRPCGRARPVIQELCARHNRRPAAEDRQLARSRFPSGRRLFHKCAERSLL